MTQEPVKHSIPQVLKKLDWSDPIMDHKKLHITINKDLVCMLMGAGPYK